jgi:hypothetical protein
MSLSAVRLPHRVHLLARNVSTLVQMMKLSYRPIRSARIMQSGVERQPPCPRATTTLAGFQAAEVGVSFSVSG